MVSRNGAAFKGLVFSGLSCLLQEVRFLNLFSNNYWTSKKQNISIFIFNCEISDIKLLLPVTTGIIFFFLRSNEVWGS